MNTKSKKLKRYAKSQKLEIYKKVYTLIDKNPYIKNSQKLIFFSSIPKEYHQVKYHMLEVAAVANILLDKKEYASIFEEFFDSKEQMKEILSLAIALHDLGKFSHEHFEKRLYFDDKYLLGDDGLYKNTKHHTIIGEAPYEGFILGYVDTINGPIIVDNTFIDENLKKILFEIKNPIIFHHGKLPFSGRLIEKILNEEEIALAFDTFRSLVKYLLKNGFNERIEKNIDITSLGEKKWALAGLVIISDWIASNTKFFPFVKENFKIVDYWKISLEKASLALKELPILGGEPQYYSDYKELLGANYLYLTPLQKECHSLSLNKGPELFIIEDIMGAGKTESSFLLLNKIMNEKSKGAFFALPSKATSNAFYSRVYDIFYKLYKNNQQSLVLVHEDRFLNDKFKKSILENSHLERGSNQSYCLEFFEKGNQSLLADIGVGTIDQLLKAVLVNKHNTLRLFGMIGKTIIFDEIHAADAYMIGLLKNLLSFLKILGCDVVLMSATLTKNQKEEMIESFYGTKVKLKNKHYPLLTRVYSSENDINFNEIKIKTRDISSKTYYFKYISNSNFIFEKIDDVIQKDSNICWIRNTVADAQKVYFLLKEKYKLNKDIEIILFHSKFLKKDRKNIEEKILNLFGKNSKKESRRKKIVIATQVIEQSLDLDFSNMITDITTADYLLQRIGRFKRHIRNKDEEVIEGIFDEREKSEIMIFGPEFIKNPTENWLSNFSSSTDFIYKTTVPYLTISWLFENNMEISVPKDIRGFMEYSFSENNNIDSFEDVHFQEVSSKKIKKNKANEFSLNPSRPFLNSEKYLKESRLISFEYKLIFINSETKGFLFENLVNSSISVNSYKIGEIKKEETKEININGVIIKKYDNMIFLETSLQNKLFLSYINNKEVQYSQEFGLIIKEN